MVVRPAVSENLGGDGSSHGCLLILMAQRVKRDRGHGLSLVALDRGRGGNPLSTALQPLRVQPERAPASLFALWAVVQGRAASFL